MVIVKVNYLNKWIRIVFFWENELYGRYFENEIIFINIQFVEIKNNLIMWDYMKMKWMFYRRKKKGRMIYSSLARIPILIVLSGFNLILTAAPGKTLFNIE